MIDNDADEARLEIIALLSGVASSADLDLDVEAQSFTLVADADYEMQHKLHLQLHCKVGDEDIEAQFDKNTKVLCIRLLIKD